MNYIQDDYQLFHTVSNIHEYIQIFFRCRKYVSYSAEKKRASVICAKKVYQNVMLSIHEKRACFDESLIFSSAFSFRRIILSIINSAEPK